MEYKGDVRLADGKRMLSYPPVFRRGIQQLLKPVNPAAGANFKFTVTGDYWDRLVTLSGTLVTAAGGAARQLAITFADGDSYVFNQTPLIGQVQGGSTYSFFADLAQSTPIQLPAAGAIEGSVTSPAAGATIATLTLTQGAYIINWAVSLSGTLAAADNNNFSLNQGATLLETSVNGIVVGTLYPQDPVEINVPAAGSTITIKAVALGTVGAIYTGQMSAIPQGSTTAQATIPDIVLEPGWSINAVLTGIQAGDQFSAMGLLLERYSSSYARGNFHENALGELREYIPGAYELP